MEIMRYFILLISIGIAYAQIDDEKNYRGEIDVFAQTGNYMCFSTKVNSNKYNLYLMNMNDSIYFQKEYDEKPIEIIICKKVEKVLVCFYRPDTDGEGEGYAYELYDIDIGKDNLFPSLHTKLKLTKDGKYLYSSVHLFENSSPLDIYNLENNEHFVIELKWSKVTSMSGNRLIILQRLSERNKKKVNFNLKLSKRRKIYIKKSRLNKMKYQEGEISESRFLAIEDSLKDEYKLFKSKAPKGNWTQLGTRMCIYDLEKKEVIYETDIKDDTGKSLILARDDYNEHSLFVNEDDFILIKGSKRTDKKSSGRENIYLKYNSNYELVLSKTIEY